MQIHQCFSSVSAAGLWQNSHNKADGFTVRSTSLRRDIPPAPQRSWGLPRGWPITHRRSRRLYTSPHGRCLRENGPSRSSPVHAASLPLLSCTVKVWPQTQQGPIYHFKKPPLWRLCVISGPVNGESAGMHIEQRYHHCGEEHLGRNLIFLFIFFCHRASNMTCIIWLLAECGLDRQAVTASKNKRNVESVVL